MTTVTEAHYATPRGARPVGVTLLAILAAITAPLAILFALLIGVLTPLLILLGGPLGVLGAAMAPLLLAYGVLCAVAAVGMFKGRRWGWFAALLLTAFGIVFQVPSLVGGEIVSAIIGVAMSLAIGWYLTQPTVQKWFGVSHALPWHRAASA